MSPNTGTLHRRRSMFWRLCRRSLQVRRPQALLGIASMLVGAAVCSLLLNLYGGVERKMTQSFSAFGANVILTPRDAGVGSGALLGTMRDPPADRFESLRTRFPGITTLPELFVVVNLNSAVPNPRFPGGENVAAVGAPLGALLEMNSNWSLQGHAASFGDCLVGDHLAREMGFRPGDRLTLGALPGATAANPPAPQQFRIAAVISAGGSADDQVFVPLGALQQMAGLSGKVSAVEVRVPADAHEIDRAMRELAGAFPDLRVRPVRQIVYSEGRVLGTVRRLTFGITALILVVAALCVGATMTAIVLERRKDVAVMKALGGSDWRVMELFMSEGAVLGLLGGIIGFFVGALLAREMALGLFDVALAPTWWVLPAVCFATAILAIVATTFSLRIVRGIQPAAALKGQ